MGVVQRFTLNIMMIDLKMYVEAKLLHSNLTRGTFHDFQILQIRNLIRCSDPRSQIPESVGWDVLYCRDFDVRIAVTDKLVQSINSDKFRTKAQSP